MAAMNNAIWLMVDDMKDVRMKDEADRVVIEVRTAETVLVFNVDRDIFPEFVSKMSCHGKREELEGAA